ncbi:hypothetical protein EKO27_g10386 [Xylaria grammica]|uniref:Uncharacterized protein n=1 Tax=Xylaria grammica TaxID=363999 RepID=A0A439CRK4_9PEZI|nr:hypothetical protein EKO27_g10386 [Xylaria grammica]
MPGIRIIISNKDMMSSTATHHTTSDGSSTRSANPHPSFLKKISRSVKRHLEPLKKLNYRDFVREAQFLPLFWHRHGHGTDHTVAMAEGNQDDGGSDSESSEFDVMSFFEDMMPLVEEDLPDLGDSELWEVLEALGALLEALGSLLVGLLTLCDV